MTETPRTSTDGPSPCLGQQRRQEPEPGPSRPSDAPQVQEVDRGMRYIAKDRNQTSWALWPLICMAVLITSLCLSYTAGMAIHPDCVEEPETPTEIFLNATNGTNETLPKAVPNSGKNLNRSFADFAIFIAVFMQNMLGLWWLTTHVSTFPPNWIATVITWTVSGVPTGSSYISVLALIGWGAVCLKGILALFMVGIMPHAVKISYYGLEAPNLWWLSYAVVQSWADVSVVALADFLKNAYERKVRTHLSLG